MKPAGKNMSVRTLPSTLIKRMHNNHLALAVGQGILEFVAQHDNERQTLAQFVRAGRWPWCPTTLQLIEHPMRGRKHARQVLLGTTRHGESMRNDLPIQMQSQQSCSL